MTREQAMAEARMVIRGMIKDEIKRKGLKVSNIEASQITKAVNHFIKTNPKFLSVYLKSKMRKKA